MNPVVAPERSLTQRMDALTKANAIRVHRKHVKAAIRAGELSLRQVLDDPLCASMPVRDALIARPGVGLVKANKALYRVMVSPAKTCAGLSTRQRVALLQAFEPASVPYLTKEER